MSIFADTLASIGKSTLNRIIAGVVAAILLIFLANKVTGWVMEAFTKAPTRDELLVKTTEQKAVIQQQTQALSEKDDTLKTTRELTTKAIGALEDWSAEGREAVVNTSKVINNLNRAEMVNHAEVTKATVLEKDEAVKAKKVAEADVRLVLAQNEEIERAYQLAMSRYGAPATEPATEQ